MTIHEYRQRLMLLYLPLQSKSGMEWHDWIFSAVRDARLSIFEAHDLLSHIYHNENKISLYCAIASLCLYQRINKPLMITRLRDRMGSIIDQYI